MFVIHQAIVLIRWPTTHIKAESQDEAEGVSDSTHDKETFNNIYKRIFWTA
jgi:hypothetical protein